MDKTLFTIGHSNRTPAEFVELLRKNNVSAIADVRSQPYSRHMPHFNRENLKDLLDLHSISYVFMGEELGARRDEDCCYVDGQAKYELIEQTEAFKSGIERIRTGMGKYVVAMMCAEKDPITCHRTILIAKALRDDCEIRHIISEAKVESQQETEQRLLKEWKLNHDDMFRSAVELLEEAYRKQAEEIAYVDKELVETQDESPTQ